MSIPIECNDAIMALEQGQICQSYVDTITRWCQNISNSNNTNKIIVRSAYALALCNLARRLHNIPTTHKHQLSPDNDAHIRAMACQLFTLGTQTHDEAVLSRDELETKAHLHSAAGAQYFGLSNIQQADKYFTLAITCIEQIEALPVSLDVTAASSNNASDNNQCTDDNNANSNDNNQFRRLAFRVYFTKLDIILSSRNYCEAKTLALRAIAYADTTNAYVLAIKLYNVGVRILKHEETNDAIIWLDTSLSAFELDTTHPHYNEKVGRSLRVLAHVLMQQGLQERALSIITRALQHDVHVDALFLRTQLLGILKRTDQAVKSLEQTLEHTACSKDMGISLGSSFHQSSPFLALRCYDLLLKRFPHDTTLRLNKLAALLASRSGSDGTSFAHDDEDDAEGQAAMRIHQAGIIVDSLISEHACERMIMSDNDIAVLRRILNDEAGKHFGSDSFDSGLMWLQRSEKLCSVIQDEVNRQKCICAQSMFLFEVGRVDEALLSAEKAHSIKQTFWTHLLRLRAFIATKKCDQARECLAAVCRSQDFEAKYLYLIVQEALQVNMQEVTIAALEFLLTSSSCNSVKSMSSEDAEDIVHSTVTKSTNLEPTDLSLSTRCTLLRGLLQQYTQHIQHSTETLSPNNNIHNSIDNTNNDESTFLKVGYHLESSVAMFSLLHNHTCDNKTDFKHANLQAELVWFAKTAWNSGLICSQANHYKPAALIFRSAASLFELMIAFDACLSLHTSNDVSSSIEQHVECEYEERIGCMLTSLCMAIGCSVELAWALAIQSRNEANSICYATLSLFDKFRKVSCTTTQKKPHASMALLYTLEFQVKMFLTDENLIQHIEACERLDGWDPKIFQSLASMAMTSPFNRVDVAMYALHKRLDHQIRKSGQTLNITKISKVYRELICLSPTLEEQHTLFNEVTHTLRTHSLNWSCDYPRIEAQWLISRAWNNGVYRFRARDLKGAEHWMSIALQLLGTLLNKDSAEKQQSEMQKSYEHVLSKIH